MILVLCMRGGFSDVLMGLDERHRENYDYILHAAAVKYKNGATLVGVDTT